MLDCKEVGVQATALQGSPQVQTPSSAKAACVQPGRADPWAAHSSRKRSLAPGSSVSIVSYTAWGTAWQGDPGTGEGWARGWLRCSSVCSDNKDMAWSTVPRPLPTTLPPTCDGQAAVEQHVWVALVAQLHLASAVCGRKDGSLANEAAGKSCPVEPRATHSRNVRCCKT